MERQGEHLGEADFGALGVGIFDGAGLHGHVDEHQHEREIAQAEDQRVLIGRAGHGVGEHAAEDQHGAGHDGGEDLVQCDVAGTALAVGGIEGVEPGREAGAEQRVYRVGHEQDDREPDQPPLGVVHELGHDGGGHDIQRIEEDFGGDEDALALFEALQHQRRKHAEAVGDQRDVGDDAHVGDGHSVHRQEACVEDAGDEHVVQRGHQRAAEADQAALGVFILEVVDVGESCLAGLKIEALHIGRTS